MEALSTNDSSQILLVLDRASQESSIRFGWVLGTALGKVLAKHSGPEYGVSSSHRAEGWGMLSGHRFLFHLSCFQQQPLPTNLQAVSSSDNAGLISCIIKRTKYQTVYANSTLSPDWDVIEQIHATQTNIGINHLAYRWVKGPQDDPTLLYTPSVEASYNIEADSLARHYLVHYGIPHTVSPVLPAAKCTLQL